MIKILRVGDPHAKVSNLEEMRKLINFIAQNAKDKKVDKIELLGDLYHSHAILRLEVQELWTWALQILSDICETVVLTGNHDLSGDYGSNFSSLSLFNLLNKKNLIIIEKPQNLGIIGYIPYIHNHKLFVDSAIALNNLGAKILVCHQTIQGSRYESGMYTPDGIPTGEWSNRFKYVISGHIHAEQTFSNIIYPGTARWDTTSDANQRKGIWIYTHEDSTGEILDSEFISTHNVCTPILEIIYAEGDNEPIIQENTKTSIVLIGHSSWINKEKDKFKGKASIKTKFTDIKTKEKRSTGKNFEDYIKNVFSSSINKKDLMEAAKELGIV